MLFRSTVDHDHFRAATILPILALVTCVVLATQQSAETWLRTGILLAVGAGLYFLQRITSGKRHTADR